jgi:hypothetical protein
MQSVWIVVLGSAGWKVVDMTGKPQAAASMGGSLCANAPSMAGAIINAVEHASRTNRRVAAVVRIDAECLLVVDEPA